MGDLQVIVRNNNHTIIFNWIFCIKWTFITGTLLCFHFAYFLFSPFTFYCSTINKIITSFRNVKIFSKCLILRTLNLKRNFLFCLFILQRKKVLYKTKLFTTLVWCFRLVVSIRNTFLCLTINVFQIVFQHFETEKPAHPNSHYF